MKKQTMKNLTIISAGLMMAGTAAFGQPMSSGRAEIMSQLAHSSAADPSLSVQQEDQNRLAMEGGTAAFELNYPFVYPSMQMDNPKLFKSFKWAAYPRVNANIPSRR